MANPEHLAKIKEGVDAWNTFSADHPGTWADLSGADLSHANLERANLRYADLGGANLWGANLSLADLTQANLRQANLREAKLFAANLHMALLNLANFVAAELRHAVLYQSELLETKLLGADLREANLQEIRGSEADLSKADLRGANLHKAKLEDTDLRMADFRAADLSEASLLDANLFAADLRQANLKQANLRKAYLAEAKMSGADLSGANLEYAHLIKSDMTKATLTDCRVYGVSAWDVKLDEAIQSNLSITPRGEGRPVIQVDNLEVAQFIYLLLNNQKIRQVIETITSKVVLILGRFTPERKDVLEAIRNELRRRDYLPVLFDFEKPSNRDLTETVVTLAHMARFVIADITDARSIPQELMAIVPGLPSVPVQPLVLSSQREYAMFEHFKSYPWVLRPFLYDDREELLAQLGEKVIGPAEARSRESRPR